MNELLRRLEEFELAMVLAKKAGDRRAYLLALARVKRIETELERRAGCSRG